MNYTYILLLDSELEDISRSDTSHFLYLLCLVKLFLISFWVRTSGVDDRNEKRNDEDTNEQSKQPAEEYMADE